MRCVLRTPGADLFEGEIDMAVLPASDGEIGILPGHASMIAALGTGACRLKTKDGLAAFALAGGFSRVHDDVVTILTTRCEAGNRIDKAGAERSLAEAKSSATPDADAREERIAWARARLAAAKSNTVAAPEENES